jgi:hypothetical protein
VEVSEKGHDDMKDADIVSNLRTDVDIEQFANMDLFIGAQRIPTGFSCVIAGDGGWERDNSI